jgi:hypothetical protein
VPTSLQRDQQVGWIDRDEIYHPSTHRTSDALQTSAAKELLLSDQRCICIDMDFAPLNDRAAVESTCLASFAELVYAEPPRGRVFGESGS